MEKPEYRWANFHEILYSRILQKKLLSCFSFHVDETSLTTALCEGLHAFLRVLLGAFIGEKMFATKVVEKKIKTNSTSKISCPNTLYFRCYFPNSHTQQPATAS
jgi:hypothetical protein